MAQIHFDETFACLLVVPLASVNYYFTMNFLESLERQPRICSSCMQARAHPVTEVVCWVLFASTGIPVDCWI